LVINT